MQNQPLVISISEAASLLGLTKEQLYELTRGRARLRSAHPIPHFKLGRRIVFKRESLERWIAALEAEKAVQQ